MIILYLENQLIGKINKPQELDKFLITEIKRIEELRDKGYYAKYPKWAKQKKYYESLPKNSIKLNSERYAVRNDFSVIEQITNEGHEQMIDNFVGYEKIAKLNIQNTENIEIYLNSFEVYENPDGRGIHGISHITMLENKKFKSTDKKITEMYTHDFNYAERKTLFQIVADIISEEFYYQEIKRIEYYNTDISFFKVWEGNLCM